MTTRIAALAGFALLLCSLQPAFGDEPKVKGVVDLTLLVGRELPAAWPVGMTPYQIIPNRPISTEPFHRETIYIDEHTGTQWDAPRTLSRRRTQACPVLARWD